jgi:hypothetical protein
MLNRVLRATGRLDRRSRVGLPVKGRLFPAVYDLPRQQ